jgi:hypothetical protein
LYGISYYGSNNFGLEYGLNYGSITIGNTAASIPQSPQHRRGALQFNFDFETTTGWYCGDAVLFLTTLPKYLYLKIDSYYEVPTQVLAEAKDKSANLVMVRPKHQGGLGELRDHLGQRSRVKRKAVFNKTCSYEDLQIRSPALPEWKVGSSVLYRRVTADMCLITDQISSSLFKKAVDVGQYNTGSLRYYLAGWEVTKAIRWSRVWSSGLNASFISLQIQDLNWL